MECQDSFFISDDFNTIDSLDEYARFKTSEHFKRIFMPASDFQLKKSLENIPCLNIQSWISRSLVIPGYHILCLSYITKDDLEEFYVDVSGWKYGYEYFHDTIGLSSIGHDISGIRQYFEILLDIQKTDEWYDRTIARQALRFEAEKEKEYMPQKWQMFNEDGEIITSMNDILSQPHLLILIFEGGQFIYPGIEVGYIREITANDRNLLLETISMRPLVFRIPSLLTQEEYHHYIESSRPYMEKSKVSFMDKDKNNTDADFRTSSTYFLCPKDGDALLTKINLIVANLTHTKITQQECTQVLKYDQNESYLSHLDFWDPKHYLDSEDVMDNIQGGHINRLATVFWYMSECQGGYTAFPNAPTSQLLLSPSLGETSVVDDVTCPYELKMKPVTGSALLFYSLLPDGSGDLLSAHTACPVLNGTKWAANKWVWNFEKFTDDDN